MPNAARKARKIARREAGYPAETAHEKDPKRATGKYMTRKELAEKRKHERIAADLAKKRAEKLAAAFLRGQKGGE